MSDFKQMKDGAWAQQVDSSVEGSVVVTPSDTVDLTHVTKGLWFEGAGTVKVTWADGSETTRTVNAGVDYPWSVKRVWATGTTATGIQASY